MSTYSVGYFVGSLSSKSINRVLSRALIRLAPDDLRFTEIAIDNLPLMKKIKAGQADGVTSAPPAHSKRTGVPGFTRLATVIASQLVRRTQPCEAVLPIFSGSGVPWMP